MPNKKDEFLDIKEDAATSSVPKERVHILGNSELLITIQRLEKNIDELKDGQKTLRRRLTWMAVGSYLRLLLFIIPIILGIFFLPKIFSGVMNQYGPLLEDLNVFGTNFSPELLTQPVEHLSDTANNSVTQEKDLGKTEPVSPQESQNFIERALSSVVEKAAQNVISHGLSEQDLKSVIDSASPQQMQLFFSKYPQLREEVSQIQQGTFQGNIEDIIAQVDPSDLQLFLTQ